MENGIKLEYLVIKEVITTILANIKITRSLKSIVDLLSPYGTYRIEDREYTGNYYKFAKEMFKRGYIPVRTGDDS